MTILCDDFGRHILGGSTNGVGVVLTLDVGLGESKVGELDVAVLADHDVFGFEITVDDVFGVEVLKRQQHLRSVEAGPESLLVYVPSVNFFCLDSIRNNYPPAQYSSSRYTFLSV